MTIYAFKNICRSQDNHSQFFRWMRLHWNQVIARKVERNILHQAMGIANMEAQRKIVNTALYVLLHRTVTAGCPLQNEEMFNYLSTFRGSSAEGILLSSGQICLTGLGEWANSPDNSLDNSPDNSPDKSPDIPDVASPPRQCADDNERPYGDLARVSRKKSQSKL